jgi:hypothetical protein
MAGSPRITDITWQTYLRCRRDHLAVMERRRLRQRKGCQRSPTCARWSPDGQHRYAPYPVASRHWQAAGMLQLRRTAPELSLSGTNYGLKPSSIYQQSETRLGAMISNVSALVLPECRSYAYATECLFRAASTMGRGPARRRNINDHQWAMWLASPSANLCEQLSMRSAGLSQWASTWTMPSGPSLAIARRIGREIE